MIKIVFLIVFLFVFIPNARSEDYAVRKSNGGVAIVHYVDGSDDSVTDVIRDMGYEGQPYSPIKNSDLPARDDRQFWAYNDTGIGPIVFVDAVKKQQYLDAVALDDANRKAVFLKLKISEAEFNAISAKKLKK